MRLVLCLGPGDADDEEADDAADDQGGIEAVGAHVLPQGVGHGLEERLQREEEDEEKVEAVVPG